MEKTTQGVIRTCTDRLSDLDFLRLQRAYDNRKNDPDGEHLRGLQIGLVTRKKWAQSRVLRCAFMDGPASVRQRVINHASRWMDYCNITFQFVDSGPADLRISFTADDGSWSYLGNDAVGVASNEPTMNFGWLDVGTEEEEYERVVLHEFGHALGCIHEHSSPAEGIQWNRDAVIKYYSGPPNRWPLSAIESNVFYRYSRAVTQFTALDPNSIMMYPIPKAFTTNGLSVPGGKTLTQSDIDFIQQQYPKGGATRPATDGLTVGGAPVTTDIGVAGEEDRFDFTIAAAGTYRVETSGTTDVVMVLAGPGDFSRVLDEDDDGGVGTNARIRRTLTPGKYQARVHHYSPRGTGQYSINLSRE